MERVFVLFEVLVQFMYSESQLDQLILQLSCGVPNLQGRPLIKSVPKTSLIEVR